MIAQFRGEFWSALLNILFPKRCLACGGGLQQGRQISYCATCRLDVQLLLEPFCLICGRPFDDAAGKSHLCGYCLKIGWHFRQARAVVRYLPAVAEAVKLFKYQGRLHGLTTFAALAQQYFQYQPLPRPDLIVPVPLHAKRLRQRGFNQALLLGRKIFPTWHHLIDLHALTRHFWTQPQTGLSGAARRRNVRNAFRVPEPEKINNKEILLVDDVFTTGATVNECARILVKYGAAAVDVFTFARAVT